MQLIFLLLLQDFQYIYLTRIKNLFIIKDFEKKAYLWLSCVDELFGIKKKGLDPMEDTTMTTTTTQQQQ